MNSSEFFKKIARANYHLPGGIKCLKLFKFDENFFSKLKSECLELASKNTPSNVSYENHVTNWTKPFGTALQYSLYNLSGDFNDTTKDHNLSVLNKKFHHAEKYPTIARFIGSFNHCINMRLNGMGKKSGLSPHEEHVVHLDKSKKHHYFRVRFHVPIQTNPQACMLLGNEFFQFNEGYLYFFNNGDIHSAKNEGDEFRFHLVWDMLLTKETFDLLFNPSFHEIPNFLKRIDIKEQQVSSIGKFKVKEYQISGHALNLYEKYKLDRFGIKPYRFQNFCNFFMARAPKKFDFAKVR